MNSLLPRSLAALDAEIAPGRHHYSGGPVSGPLKGQPGQCGETVW